MNHAPPATDTFRAHAHHIGAALARTAAQRGLAVTRPDGERVAIPISATPVILTRETIRHRQHTAALLASAGHKMATAALNNDTLRSPLLRGLSPLEAELAQQPRTPLLATTRVDFFVGASLQALELNTTIPAMQGYSDIAADALIDVAGQAAGASAATIAQWQAQNGNNSAALLDALLRGHQQFRPHTRPARIGVLCRRHDAQLTELLHLRDRFIAAGFATDLLYPDTIEDDDDAIRASGHRYDLIYRHLFVRRTEEPNFAGAGAVQRLLREPNGTRAVLLNPPSSLPEMKSVFALLSLSQIDDELATHAQLSDAERNAIAHTVPWTRLLTESLINDIADAPDRYVLKRAWDYGGRAVFVGHGRFTSSFTQRVQAVWPGAATDWRSVCEQAAHDTRGGGFVVQERVAVTPSRHVLCHEASTSEVDLFVDFSTYASVGLTPEPAWGAVCRGSTAEVVNIMGGGGVVPILDADVAAAIGAALTAAHAGALH